MRSIWGRKTAGLLGACLVGIALGVGIAEGEFVGSPQARASALSTDLISDAEFILGATVTVGTDTGAISEYPSTPPTYIDPYQNNYAAWGLARAYAFTGNATYASAAWAALNWYSANENASNHNVVYPETLSWNGADSAYTQTPGTIDSYASYAATFLIAAYEAYNATGNTAAVTNLIGSSSSGITGALNGLIALLSNNYDLDAATPGGAFYTLDNAEVYAGVTAAVSLLQVLGDTSEALVAQILSGIIKSGMLTGCSPTCSGVSGRNTQGLLNPTTGLFANGRASNGVISGDVNTSSTTFDPDASEQMWPVALGNFVTPETPLLNSSQVSTLTGFVSSYYPQWDSPGSSTLLTGNPNATAPFYSLVFCIAFDVAGNQVLAQSGLNRIEAYALSRTPPSTGRAWPYSTGVSGEALVAEMANFGDMEDQL